MGRWGDGEMGGERRGDPSTSQLAEMKCFSFLSSSSFNPGFKENGFHHWIACTVDLKHTEAKATGSGLLDFQAVDFHL